MEEKQSIYLGGVEEMRQCSLCGEDARQGVSRSTKFESPSSSQALTSGRRWFSFHGSGGVEFVQESVFNIQFLLFCSG
ncbi:uncharacterized protein G2W53_003644 [Senna tora]|uniref:Uncharacterized protein n=1 Tax=Senna tora TaxID=362788 RepID=A0A835CFY1_9FABA|nr:uncharacterized protein G2W53_003644 [Senna tora]